MGAGTGAGIEGGGGETAGVRRFTYHTARVRTTLRYLTSPVANVRVVPERIAMMGASVEGPS